MEGGKAGVHNSIKTLDSRVRGNDRNGAKRTFYKGVKIALQCFERSLSRKLRFF